MYLLAGDGVYGVAMPRHRPETGHCFPIKMSVCPRIGIVFCLRYYGSFSFVFVCLQNRFSVR